MIYISVFLRIKLLFFVFFCFSSYGKIFQSSYIEFDISKNWVCKSFGVDWVCHHYIQDGSKPALILITAKEGSPSDRLDLYFQDFSREQPAPSKTIHVKKLMIHNHTWIDSFYKNNILQNMFSRYMTTICCDSIPAKIHILIGFHAHETNYTEYSNEFLRAIKSLSLPEDLKETLRQLRQQTDSQRKDMLSYIEQILFEVDNEESTGSLSNQKRRFSFIGVAVLFGLALLFLLGLYYFFQFYWEKGRRRRTIRQKYKK